MRVILQMFGFRFEESVSSTLPLSLLSLSMPLPNWFLPGVRTCVNSSDSLAVSVPFSLSPTPAPLSYQLIDMLSAVGMASGCVCVCVCVKCPSVCTIHLWTGHTLFLSLCPAMNNIPCLFNVNLAQLHP